MLQQILSNLIAQNRLLFETASSIRLIADDSPTKHYGKKIEGCGWHHNPTPGGSDATLCWGHSWVVICLVLTHPLWGEVCFPIATTLYVQQKVVDLLKGKYKIEFKTKCAILVDLVTDLMPYFEGFPCRIEVIMDGGYAKESVIKPLCKLQKVCVITRLRRDGRVFELPPQRTGKRGRPSVKGKQINMEGKVNCSRGWDEVECDLYGKKEKKKYKTFVAVSELTHWQPVRIVLIKENDKTWVPLMCTNIALSAKEIIESYGVRFGIEEVFKDLKDNYGWGKQEVRNLWSVIATTAMNMLMYNITELCCWDIPATEIVDRTQSPWDNPERRPSHRNKRNYLKIKVIEEQLKALLLSNQNPQKIFEEIKNLILAA